LLVRVCVGKPFDPFPSKTNHNLWHNSIADRGRASIESTYFSHKRLGTAALAGLFKTRSAPLLLPRRFHSSTLRHSARQMPSPSPSVAVLLALLPALATHSAVALMGAPPGSVEYKPGVVLEHDDGGRYRGEVNEKDEKHGPGRYTWPDGSYFDGMWQHNERQGMGEYRYPSGATYDGEWKNSKPHGHGTYTWCVAANCTAPHTPAAMSVETSSGHTLDRTPNPCSARLFLFRGDNILGRMAAQSLGSRRTANTMGA
jgi:hypothetical protein